MAAAAASVAFSEDNSTTVEVRPDAGVPDQSDIVEPAEGSLDAGLQDAGPETVEYVPPSTPESEADAGEPHDDQSEPKLHWRDDPKTLRHPGSYIGLAIGYNNARTWFVPQEDEFDDEVSLGPYNGWQFSFRTGDAFKEWFAIGFQIDMSYGGYGSEGTIGAFGLLLDTTFYPWRGLGIRPSLGLGFSYAQGKEQFEFGFGGPGSLSLALTYEFRVSRLIALAPVVQASWITGEDFNGLFFFFGLEFLKWFDTPTG